MKKNMNENFEITVDEMTEIFGDTPVEMSFREVKEGMDSFFGLMGLTVELVNLIRKEDELKKHHRAYLHVREEIAECANEATEVIGGILDSIQEKEHIYRVSGTPSAFDMDEEGEYEDDFVTIPKEKYDSMIEDLLTMAELIDMVSDMRTKDVRAIQEFGKFIPAYAAYERNRLSLYREAAKEAESIITAGRMSWTMTRTTSRTSISPTDCASSLVERRESPYSLITFTPAIVSKSSKRCPMKASIAASPPRRITRCVITVWTGRSAERQRQRNTSRG